MVCKPTLLRSSWSSYNISLPKQGLFEHNSPCKLWYLILRPSNKPTFSKLTSLLVPSFINVCNHHLLNLLMKYFHHKSYQIFNQRKCLKTINLHSQFPGNWDDHGYISEGYSLGKIYWWTGKFSSIKNNNVISCC